jgi:hypothetical protein
MERVVGNYHVCVYKAKLERKAAKAAARLQEERPALLKRMDSEMEENPYETDEHVSAGLFTRKVLSHLDLQELAKIHHE